MRAHADRHVVSESVRMVARVGRIWQSVVGRRRFRVPEQSIRMTSKRWAELLDLQRRQDEQR